MLLQPRTISLGPPPWSGEELERAVLVNLNAVQSALQNHAGRGVAERLTSVTSALRLFNKTGITILGQIERFHHEAHHNNLFRRNRRDDRQRFEEELQEQLYVFAACSMTLVDQARSLTDKFHVPGYRERVTSTFSDSPRHRFIQELRVDMIHVTLHEPSWQLTSGADDNRKTRFLIHPEQLRRAGEYHALAKQFVANNPGGIDVASLVLVYSEEVNALHTWLRGAVEAAASEILADLRRCRRIVAAVGSRTWWRLILSQVVIQGGRDPYAYLDQYLSPEEMWQVQSLPHRSKLQVDRIVELVDDESACNAELRELVYKAFGVRGT